MLESQRDKFALPPEISYLDCAYMSPIPLASIEAGKRGTAVKAEPWKMTIDSYYDGVEEARTLAAGTIGATADDVAVIAATSYGLATAAKNVPVPAGSTIILMENEHPSHRYVWYELAEQNGGTVTVVAKPEDGDWTPTLVAAIRDSGLPVAVVAGTLLHWFEGTRVDIEQVAEAVREAGACLVMDGTQWVGAVPFDVREIQPDFLSFATYKFLLGPYRLGFLYASERWHREGKPLEHHAWHRYNGDKPDFYVETVPGYKAGARRFDMGERSDFAVLPVAIESLKLIESLGLPAISERLSFLNDRIWEEALRHELVPAIDPLRVPHISILDMKGRLPEGVGAKLKAENIHVTVRGVKVRVSPHIYNDEKDITRLFEVLSANALD
ncbi:MAG: selenocysteine lyase [Rhizobiales bacterium]|nr:selenocysteine lyase [Hyphomicrobiales bacterium]